MTTSYFFSRAFLGDRWANDVRLSVDASGAIAALETNTQPNGAEVVPGVALPGMANLHGHAFQRAMAGAAEHAAGADSDTFWTWRETMYALANAITPETLEAIATWLYVDMVKAGYTHVAEFHYVHHQPGGAPYGDPAEMALTIVRAARRAGIGLTLLPVLYQASGFGGGEPRPEQRRFVRETDDYLSLMERLSGEARLGVAFHSLRAVGPEAMRDVLAWRGAHMPDAPVHIHIAEQQKEVDDCLAWSGARPVAWLLDHADVDERWCLVHATHTDEIELAAMASRGAVVGLCPTTEANLGDGVFALRRFLDAGGRFGIGSDSHISVSPIEELRWLEYGQRLVTQSRNVAASPDTPHVGRNLWERAVAGGAQACGVSAGRLEPGARADVIVVDADAPVLFGKDEDALLDAFIFAGDASLVRHVLCAGVWRVRDGRHEAEEETATAYKAAAGKLSQ